ncbi:MAG: hypothetical protein LH632_14465 [Rhodoferax sp.]|nr:hypothetical protein [Rhodoferax sp.]
MAPAAANASRMTGDAQHRLHVGLQARHDYQPPFASDGALRSVSFGIPASRPLQARGQALTAGRVTKGLQ